MSQPFRFDFGQHDDVEDDDIADNHQDQEAANQQEGDTSDDRIVPCVHTLDDLLSTLPSTISYTAISIQSPGHGDITLTRRELFDIRTQLMIEDTGLDDSSTAGLSTDDIKPNIYEGGFKTWECSVDLTNYLASHEKDLLHQSDPCTIVELGAGTALPSLFLFHLLFNAPSSTPPPRRTFVLADFNPSVLQLATIPNLLIMWAFASNLISSKPGDLDITSDVTLSFRQALTERNIVIRAISGSWGPEFSALAFLEFARPPEDVLILASETIYSPKTTLAFTITLLDLMGKSQETGGRATALVAAKKVYFGVGGGVDEFSCVLREHGAAGKIVWSTEGMGSGVGRCILKLTGTGERRGYQSF
ncbi:MAG: hypothetical protein Q9223_000464 [Gallowayella weberi]